MNLRGSLVKLQRCGANFYSELARNFHENLLIREAWVTLSQDLEQHYSSLRTLPPSFWKHLKPEETSLREGVTGCSALKGVGEQRDTSLHGCCVSTLAFEEPLSLGVYAPLVRAIRKEQTQRALDFYILVKAHITRLTRTIQLFSGDPLLIRRSMLLLESFEKEVQGPAVPLMKPRKRAKKKSSVRKSQRISITRRIRRRLRIARAIRAPRVLGKRAKALAKRAKPLVGKIKIGRRRARG